MKSPSTAKSVDKLRWKPISDLLGHDVSEAPGMQGPTEALLNLQGRPAKDVWTQREWITLCQHLHNENGPTEYIMGFRQDGQKR